MFLKEHVIFILQHFDWKLLYFRNVIGLVISKIVK